MSLERYYISLSLLGCVVGVHSDTIKGLINAGLHLFHELQCRGRCRSVPVWEKLRPAGALRKHQHSCGKTKKRLAGASSKAKEVWLARKRRCFGVQDSDGHV